MPRQDADRAHIRRAQAAVRRGRWIAYAGSIALHAFLLGLAPLIVLRSPERHDSSVEVVLQPSAPPEAFQRNIPAAGDAPPAQSPGVPPLPRPDIPLPAALPDIVISMPAAEPSDARDSFEIPTSPLERTWTPEEAYAELTRLLEEYPQFREQVLRELIAGKGFAPDTVQHIDLYLDRIFARGIKPSWGNQRQTVEGASRSFDGVSGWKQNSNYGGGINVIGLLKFLYDLIDGE